MMGTCPMLLVTVPACLPSTNQLNVAASLALYDDARSLHCKINKANQRYTQNTNLEDV